MDLQLNGKRALVTGASAGLGTAIARTLAAEGCTVVVHGRNEERAQKVANEIVAAGGKALIAIGDIATDEGANAAADTALAALGGIDILVHNAGNAVLSGGVLHETPADWDSVIATQLNSVFLLSKIAATSMVALKRGKIINLGSMYSYFGSGFIPSYSAAKGAIVQLTKSMAIELAPHNIQVNAIAPGWIETDMTAPVRTPDFKAMHDEVMARTPAGRWGQSEEVAGTAVYLASRASQFVTGETIRVDGGYAIR